MKQLSDWMLGLCIVLFLGSCGSSKQEQAAEDEVYVESEEPDGPIKMQASEEVEKISWKDKQYTAKIVRRPSEQLPLVKNAEGDTFIDNTISLKVSCGSKVLLDRMFTKKDFSEQVNAQLLEHSILEGLVFDKTTPQGLQFAASVAYPQTDLYQPVRILVSAIGTLTISREEELEENPDFTE